MMLVLPLFFTKIVKSSDYVSFRSDYGPFRSDHRQFRSDYGLFRSDYRDFGSDSDQISSFLFSKSKIHQSRRLSNRFYLLKSAI
jgi:hypothetical protein